MLTGFADSGAAMLAAIDIPDWLRSAWSLLMVMLGFSFVVFVHELGHFLAAKWAKVRVEKFAIGFGHELFGFNWGETRYCWNALPLGGYVKMLGQEDFAVDKTGELKVKDDEGSFTNKTVGQRMVIVSAGVIMNLILAAIGLTAYMMIGYRTPPAIIGTVAPQTPASRAGLRPGDEIKAINGRQVREFEDVRMQIVLSDPGEVLTFDVQRDGKPVEPSPRLLPDFMEEQRVRQAGLAGAATRRVMVSGVSLSEEYAENELQPNDLVLAILRGEQRTPIHSFGELSTALAAARGAPLDLEVKRPSRSLATEELVSPDDDKVEGRVVRVRANAGWYVQPEDVADGSTASLLGLVPRLRAGSPEERAPADLAGVQPGDIIVAFGDVPHPSQSEFMKLVWQYENRDVPLVVRRPRSPRDGLSADTQRLLCLRREAYLEAAAADIATARILVDGDLRTAGTPEAEHKIISRRMLNAATADAWRVWLDSIDQQVLTVRPTRPFSLWGQTKPRIGLPLDLPEDDRLIVADVRAEVGGRPSPAAQAGIPRGAVILAADGKPLESWAELTAAFRAAAGRSVRLHYRSGVQFAEASLQVPQALEASLELPYGARIASIGGLERAEVLKAGGETQTLYLPDWRAIAALLKQNVGRTVPVKWTDAEGERHEGEYAVTPDNADPWLSRIEYVPLIIGYPMLVQVRETNPLEAAWAGIRKTHYATWNTIQSIRHIAFTQQIGVNQLKGPVGIARLGMQIAEYDWRRLLWFMCLISANLAVINALPLPIVDGGLFFFLILEKIRGEPLSIKTQVVTQILGIALIASVFLFVTVQDIMNWNQ